MIDRIRNFVKGFFPVQPSLATGRDGPVDYYRNQARPDIKALLEAYKGTAFSCANINANACARVPLKLYVKTKSGQRNPRLKTKSLSRWGLQYLEKSYGNHFSKSLKNVEEVLEHPVLDLLKEANDSPFLNGQSLSVFTFLYQEVTGKAYWRIDNDDLFEIPMQIWLMPTQHVTPYQTIGSTNIIDYYEYFDGVKKQKLPVNRVIQYLTPNLKNPYVGGFGSLLGSWEHTTIVNKLISHETNMLDNQARPDYLASPGSDGIAKEEAEAIERKLSLRFGRGRGGGPFVSEEELKITPLTWPPADIAKLEIEKYGSHAICNAFDVPIVLLDSENISKATLEAALTQHALLGVDPRLKRDAAIKNDCLLSRYDTSGRLFFAYDNPVPEDKEVLLQETVQLKMNGMITANEGRDRYNYPRHPQGDKLETANTANNSNSGNKRQAARKVTASK